MSLSVTVSTYVDMEPLSRAMLWPVNNARPRACKRSEFGQRFTDWRCREGLTVAKAAALIGCKEWSARKWGLDVTPGKRFWVKLRNLGLDPAPFRKWSRANYTPLAIRKTFAAEMVAWRKAKEWSQLDLACELGLCAGTIQHWEAGRNMPRPKQQDALLARGFTCSVWPNKSEAA